MNAGGRWVTLPQNQPRLAATVVPVTIGKFGDSWFRQAIEMGKAPDGKTATVVELIFEGSDDMPAVPEADVLVAFVGSARGAVTGQSAGNAAVTTYPAVEMAATTKLPSGVRSAYVFPIAPGVYRFGDSRCPATLEQPRQGVILLRCNRPPTPGRYAVWDGSMAYEVRVE